MLAEGDVNALAAAMEVAGNQAGVSSMRYFSQRGFFARRLGFFGSSATADIAAQAAHGLLDAAEERALWARFGL